MSNLVCECGKTFENPQSFNGHKSNCKVHLIAKYGSLDLYYQKQKSGAIKGGKSHTQNANAKKELALQQWINEKHQCEHCGKIMTEKFGAGRFCCRACANSRTHSEEVKEKIRNSVSNTQAYFNPTTKETKYFKLDEIIPEGWIKGNLGNVKNKDEWVKGNIIYSQGRKKSTYKSKKHKVLPIPYQTLKREFRQEYLQNQILQNELILKEYISLLNSKINGRTYKIPDNCKTSGKYLCVDSENHPRAIKYKNKRIHIHILMAEELLGRYLTDDEIVHHINENKYDNRFDNILIFDTQASHARFHYNKECVLSIDNDRLVCSKLIYPKFDYDSYYSQKYSAE